jgi:hypothetical protein
MGKLSKVNNGGREKEKWANTSLKKGRGIYTPPRNVAVAVLQGRIFRSKFGPDILPFPPKTTKDFARVVQIWGRIFWPDISKLGRIIRPPLKTAKDQKLAKCASLRFKAGYFGRIFPKLSRIIRPGRASNTKTTITFASGLRFRWSCARWNHHNELYNIIHRNIIVQQRRMKPNDKRFDLAKEMSR